MQSGKIISVLGCCLLMAYCTAQKADEKTDTLDEGMKTSIFHQLMTLTNNEIPPGARGDSMAFLILPLNNSCPSCRDKTMDSISRHINNLSSNHFIILSADDGIKNMRSTFRENGYKLPVAPGKVFLDSTNTAYIYDLYSSNPAMFYTADSKVFKKVFSLPGSVKQDLAEFFSGMQAKND